jgi:hypothetical protein
MSLQLLAKQMEAKGRGGDSVLVHMTPEEVEGLQKLAEAAGGSLTVNPETGLVEANFLKKMLPTLVGAGLMMVPGVGLAAATAGGALAGGIQARREGESFGKGALMGGLGAYGGASLAGGLMGAGNAAVSQAATAANPAFMGPMPGAASSLGATKAGITSLGGEAGRGAFMQSVGGGGGLAKAAGMAAAPALAGMGGAKETPTPSDDEMIVYDYNPGYTGAEMTPSDSSAERQYFAGSYSAPRKVRASEYFAAEGGMVDSAYADGGIMGLAKGGMKSGGFVVPADVVSMVGEGNTEAGYSRIKSMIPGATAIKGKDGGQADTVKTSIEGKQPARVAHGEMYIPPETVKRMGGAKKLYAMMDKVRAQATGSKKQIKPVSLKQALA